MRRCWPLSGAPNAVRLQWKTDQARGRFRKDLRLDLGGVRPRPDIVFTRRKVAVYVDGCWHACPEHSSAPRNNAGYWGPKLRGNVERDKRYDLALEAHGWRVVRAWEHEPVEAIVDKVEAAVVESA